MKTPRTWRKAARKLQHVTHLRARTCSLRWWAGKLGTSPHDLAQAMRAEVNPMPLLIKARSFCASCGRLNKPQNRTDDPYCDRCIEQREALNRWCEANP